MHSLLLVEYEGKGGQGYIPGKWERNFFSPLPFTTPNAYYTTSTLYHHYYTVLLLILPVPTRVFYAVACGNLTFRLVLVNHIVCLDTSSRPVPSHPIQFSRYPFLRFSFRFNFFLKDFSTVAALGSTVSVIGSFHRCTRLRMCASLPFF